MFNIIKINYRNIKESIQSQIIERINLDTRGTDEGLSTTAIDGLQPLDILYKIDEWVNFGSLHTAYTMHGYVANVAALLTFKYIAIKRRYLLFCS